MAEWMDGRAGRCLNGEDDEWIARWIRGCMHGHIVEWAGKWLDGWGEGRISSRRVCEETNLSSLCERIQLKTVQTEWPCLGWH